jgi:hypothetical protein
MRRQLRERRREREARLLDLGALVYELHRQGKRAPELLQEKAAELVVVDEDVRRLEAALDGDEPGADGVAEGAHEGDETAVTEETDALELGAESEAEAQSEPEADSEERPA